MECIYNYILGEQVLVLTAKDDDEGAALQYSIIEPITALDKAGVVLGFNSQYEYKKVFTINSETGSVTISGGLDYNSASVITFTVQVEDVNAQINTPQTATGKK